MELTPDRLTSLNRLMIQMGAPNIKDDKGYNIVDYNRMASIAQLYVPLSFDELFAVVSSLYHYKNTQLKHIKDDLDETYEIYKKQAEDKHKLQFDDNIDIAAYIENYCEHHNKSDYKSRTLKFISKDDYCFVVKFCEYIENINLKDYGGQWVKTNVGTAMRIPFSNADSFLEDIKSQGQYGYNAPQELIDAIEEYKNRKTEKTIYFDSLNQMNEYGYDLFMLNVNDAALTKDLWELKGEGLKYIKPDGARTIISTTQKMLPTLVQALNAKGIDTSHVKVKSLDEIAQEKALKNKSDNKLVDINTLKLPFKPYPFQIEDATKVISMKKALMGHDMGCGKTFMSVLIGMSIRGKKLVICPETLRLNWYKEIRQVDRSASVKVVYSKDKPNFTEYRDWTIVGYKTAVKFGIEIIQNIGNEPTDYHCMFVDEAHKCKAVTTYGKPASQQAGTVMAFARKIPYAYLLTGTPMPTRNKDLYNILVMLGEIDDTKKYAFHHFGIKYCDGQQTAFGWDYNGSSNSSELHSILTKYMVRRLKSDVLPNLKKQRIPIIIESPLSKEYRQIEKRLHEPTQDDTYLGLAMTGRRLLSLCKTSSAIEFAETIVDGDKSVVIVAEFDETLDVMMSHFKDKAVCIRGGMSDRAKEKAVRDFQNGFVKICCINLIAAGLGITLTAAHNMIIIDYDWTPANMTQVEDRICRSGQTEPCNIYYLYHNAAIFDEIFMEMISDKSENIDYIIDNKTASIDLASMKTHTSKNNYLSRLKAHIEKENTENSKKKRKSAKMKT